MFKLFWEKQLERWPVADFPYTVCALSRFSHIQQSATLVGCSPPGSSAQGISQARITGVIRPFYHQGSFPIQGPNLFLSSPAMEGGSFDTSATWEAPKWLAYSHLLKSFLIIFQKAIFPNAKTCIPITPFPKEHTQAVDKACRVLSFYHTNVSVLLDYRQQQGSSRFIFPVDHVVHLPNAVP